MAQPRSGSTLCALYKVKSDVSDTQQHPASEAGGVSRSQLKLLREHLILTGKEISYVS